MTGHTPRWLNKPLVLAIQREQVMEHGGSAGLRDEGLLKLFFSEDRDRAEVREHMRAARARSEEVVAQFRSMKPDLGEPEPGPMLVLQFGIELNEWMADWWRRAEERA